MTSTPDLLSYVGAITGVVGAVTGISGAVMGYVSYRRSEQLKALDLRLELRKSVSDLFNLLQEIPNLLENAKKSRMRVAAATGRNGSGAMQRWLAQFDADKKSLESLDEGLAELNVDHSQSSHATLETKLVEAHSLLATVNRFRQKYEACIAEDDNERNHIREDVRARTGPPP